MKRCPVTQEHGTGCGVACTAFVLNLTYSEALYYFLKPAQAWGRGFYCREVVAALGRAGKTYTQSYVKSKGRQLLKIPGMIVFVGRSEKYPLGHYLVRTIRGDWMNPWINFPVIAPAKSGFQRRLPGKVIYVLYPAG